MKCPKCGYNSFEFLDSCKKCGTELETLKRTYRISPVLLHPDKEAPNYARQDMSSGVAEMALPDTAVPAQEKTTEEFSWDVPGAPAADEKTEAYSGFDLNFPGTEKSEEPEEKDIGFSFVEEPVSPAPDMSHAEVDKSGFEFAFSGSTEEEHTEPKQEEISAGNGTGLEEYERMLEPESLQADGSSSGSAKSDGLGESGTFGIPDFSFETDTTPAGVTDSTSDPAASADAEKKPKPNLEDFEKEFEKIFE